MSPARVLRVFRATHYAAPAQTLVVTLCPSRPGHIGSRAERAEVRIEVIGDQICVKVSGDALVTAPGPAAVARP